jgi:hypothetical protein
VRDKHFSIGGHHAYLVERWKRHLSMNEIAAHIIHIYEELLRDCLVRFAGGRRGQCNRVIAS